jgi:plasmid stability protein
MANVTLSIDDDVLRRCRAYAEAHGISLNALIRELLERAVPVSSDDAADQELNALMDDLKVSLRGKRWTRDELYDV